MTLNYWDLQLLVRDDCTLNYEHNLHGDDSKPRRRTKAATRMASHRPEGGLAKAAYRQTDVRLGFEMELQAEGEYVSQRLFFV